MNDEIIGSTLDKAELQTVFEKCVRKLISSMKPAFPLCTETLGGNGNAHFYQRNTDVAS